jgi:hypothetical protein
MISKLNTARIGKNGKIYGAHAQLWKPPKEKCPGVALTNEDVYMATTLDEFVTKAVVVSRGGGGSEFTFDAVNLRINNMDIQLPHQGGFQAQQDDGFIISGVTPGSSYAHFTGGYPLKDLSAC